MFSKETLEALTKSIKWKSSCGEVLVCEMETDHLRNAIYSLKCRCGCCDEYQGFTNQQWIEILSYEADRREEDRVAKVRRATELKDKFINARVEAMYALNRALELGAEAQKAYEEANFCTAYLEKCREEVKVAYSCFK